MSEIDSVENLSLRSGFQALYIESQEAKHFGLKNPMAEAPQMIRKISDEIKKSHGSYICSTALTGSTGGFIGLIVVAEGNPEAIIHTPDTIKPEPGLNVIPIESELSNKFGSKDNKGQELTEKVDNLLNRLPKGSKVVNISAVPGGSDGASVGLVMVVNFE
jgi:hypothetical protein